jgi:hypothetical protein
MVTKNHILEEIQRTASENGGTALGKGRFLAETGIKESDWSGKYWTRWSEAIAEAGFSPNKLNQALSDDQLLGALAKFVQELGHFPVDAELRMKARNDKGFPSTSTLKRYGGKSGVAARLLEFATERELPDVAGICGPVAVQEVAVAEKISTEEPFGFVYLLRSGKFHKIGRSNAVGRRERELAIQLPEKATLVHSIKTDDPAGIEDYWHRRFRDRRKNGEWFALTVADVTVFRRRRFM